MNKKYFRTKLDKTLEEQLSQFEYWDEIQPLEVDVAFESYLCSSYISNKTPKEVGMVFKLIEKGGLLGLAVEAHEKWEVLEFLRKKYTLEQIRDGTAHKAHRVNNKWKDEDVSPHAEARFKEYSLYRFLYDAQFGKKSPPLYAFLLVTPHIEIFGEEVHNVDVTIEHLDYLIGEFGKYKSSIISEKCSKKDLKNSMKFFEKNGYTYNNRNKMLKRAENFIRKY